MEKKIIRRCYGRKYQLVEVPKKHGTFCPGCVFDGKEKFCTKTENLLSKEEMGMEKLCSTPARSLYRTLVWEDITPAWKRWLNTIIGRE